VQSKSGSILGGVLLIAGSCIGAGMLALPILTGLAGFFPSIGMFLCAWAFMTLTALLLVEVNGWFTKQVNIVSMAEHSLGRFGMILSWVLYLFLFYALLVAYVSGSGGLSSTFFKYLFSWSVPSWAGSLFFVVLFGYVVLLGTRSVDLSNRFLMGLKIAAFIGLVVLGLQAVKPQLLFRSEPRNAIFALPILVISFGFHNMIPSLTAYLGGDLKRVKKTIIGGSLFTLGIYLVWQLIVLGILPLDGPSGIKESLKNDSEASQAIAGILGSSWVSNCAQALAFFAILTSFLAQSLSLVHFLADGLKINYEKKENPWLCMLALAPPLIFSLAYPKLFFSALNFAGGICAVILFGILPASMVWIGRYRKNLSSRYQVRGGRPLLIFIFLFSFFVLFFQLSHMFNASYLPQA
jgi:tyrosine-specific transport protein